MSRCSHTDPVMIGRILEAVQEFPVAAPPQHGLKLLFLDIDGVLNDHVRFENGYCPIKYDKALHLNTVLRHVPDLQIVLSSAWRYAFDTPYLVEQTLCRSGVNAYQRVHGVTSLDPLPDDAPPYTDKVWWDAQGLLWRNDQISNYVAAYQPQQWAAVDDLPLTVEHLFLADPEVGLTNRIAWDIICHFEPRQACRAWVGR